MSIALLAGSGKKNRICHKRQLLEVGGLRKRNENPGRARIIARHTLAN
jgi:hypothetical protein